MTSLLNVPLPNTFQPPSMFEINFIRFISQSVLFYTIFFFNRTEEKAWKILIREKPCTVFVFIINQ